jgi:hypothetical protein
LTLYRLGSLTMKMVIATTINNQSVLYVNQLKVKPVNR